MNNSPKRRLAAVLFADIVGYTALMQTNEPKALATLNKFKTTLDTQVPAHHGEVINFYGDGCLSTFSSAVDATACAKSLQQAFQTEPQVAVRIGIHMGDVVFKEDNAFGDTVNIASRIESMGIAGSILLSNTVWNQIKNQATFDVSPLGKFEFKNVEEAMPVYALIGDGLIVPKPNQIKGKFKEKKTSVLQYALIGLIGLLTVGLIYFLGIKNDEVASQTISNAISIFPFDVKGSPDIQYLSEGMVDLVSTNLDGLPDINSIDPNLIFNQLQKPENQPLVLESATNISRQLGAREFLLGSIVEVGDEIRVTASKYDASGKLLVKDTKQAEKGKLSQLVDDISKSLVADELTQEGQEFNSLAATMSQSLPALRAYLKGEQAFRKANANTAFEHYSEAVRLDSTFAMAWMRLADADSWAMELNAPQALDKAIKYKDKMPKKWQDFIDAKKLYSIGHPDAEAAIQNLIEQYGEAREFTNLMAEYLFHFNPVHGKSLLEAKPWLIKTRELDPANQEAFIHLGDIAFAERDKERMEVILAETDSSSQHWPKFQQQYLSMLDTVTSEQIQEVVNHNYFRSYFMNIFMIAPEDPLGYYRYLQKYLPYIKNPFSKAGIQISQLSLMGKEEEAHERARQLFASTNVFNRLSSLCRYASIISGNEFLPNLDGYETLFKATQKEDDPWAIFACAKYAFILDKQKEYQINKKRLLEVSKTETGTKAPATFYYYSLVAFEKRIRGDNDQALLLIDSAFQYSPGYWPIQGNSIDKIMMRADIYEEQKAYEKAIAQIENLPTMENFTITHGYATYRLTQLYELAGQIDKAFAKCDLFIRDYADCDEQYQPWLTEVKARRERLMAKEL